MGASSRAGTTIGGWLTIRYFPSTSSPSLDSACRLSRVCALARVLAARFPAVFAAFSSCLAALPAFVPAFPGFFSCLAAPATALRIPVLSSSSSRWAYQMSIVGICAKEAIASR